MLILGLLLSGLLLIFLLYNVKIYLGRRPLSHIPSPPLSITPLWCLGHIPMFSAKIKQLGEGHSYLDAFASIQKDIGQELIALFFLSANIIFCTDVDITGKILLDHRVFMKMTKEAQQGIGLGTHYIDGNRIFGPRGILFEPGTDVWYFKRKTMDPAFHKKYLRTLLDDMNDLSDSFVGHLLQKMVGQPSVDIFPMFCKFTLDTVCKCSFSLDVGAMASEVSPLNEAANDIFSMIQISYDNLSWQLPWTFRKEKALIKSKMDFVHSILRDTLKKRLESQIQYEDTLSYIINANLFDESRPQTEVLADILDDFWTILFAGMETTANTLAYCMFYMLKHSDIYQKVRDEVDDVLAGKACLDYEDLDRLVYMEQVIKEVLRRHAPGTAAFRVPYSNSPTVCGTVIPKDSIVVIGVDVIHHRPDLWEAPYTFDPDRFTPGTRIKPFTHMPFTMGPRNCIGKNFAIMEMKIVLSKMLTNFTFTDPLPGLKEIETMLVFTEKPKHGVHIGFEKRKIE